MVFRSSILAAVLALGGFYACSPNSGDSATEQPFGTGSAGSSGRGGKAANTGAGGASGSSSGTGAGTGTLVIPRTDGGHTIEGPDGSCNAISQAPEVITVYKDATVTDTVTTYKPVALYIMQDRSGSMDESSGNQTKWEAAVNGVTTFVNDPNSTGLDVGLGVFEPKTGGPGMCDGSDCGVPIVPIAPLPQNAQNIVSGYGSVSPNGKTPIECALRGAINQCLVFQANSSTGEQCAVVFITDGEPTSCNRDPNFLVSIVTDAYSKGITLFALGMQGANFGFLDQLAQAGGTTQAFDVTVQSAFEAALDTIRNKIVTVTSAHQVVTQQVIKTELACQWTIPLPPAGKSFDKNQLNVSLTNPGGTETQFGNVPTPADCSRAPTGWYYDNPTAPTQVHLCSQACETVKASTGTVNILFGCSTIPVIFH